MSGPPGKHDAPPGAGTIDAASSGPVPVRHLVDTFAITGGGNAAAPDGEVSRPGPPRPYR
ncbi:hypothetical protein GCM10017687_90550 [Streptomyces echinatus]